MLRDRHRIGRKVEHTAHPRNDRRKSGELGKAHRRPQRVAGAALDRHGTMRAVEFDRPGVAISADGFDTRDRATAQELEHCRPVVGRVITQQKNDLTLRTGRAIRTADAPQLARRATEQREEGFVEAADAAEPRRESNFGHRQAGLMNKLLGEEDAPRLRHRHR